MKNKPFNIKEHGLVCVRFEYENDENGWISNAIWHHGLGNSERTLKRDWYLCSYLMD